MRRPHVVVCHEEGEITAVELKAPFQRRDAAKLVEAANRIASEQHESIAIIFATVDCRSVQGHFRYRDEFQLLPIPDAAPTPKQLIAPHPCILELKWRKSEYPLIDASRLRYTTERVLDLLAVALKQSFCVPENGGCHYAWVLNGSTPELRQIGYALPGERRRSSFSTVESLPRLPSERAAFGSAEPNQVSVPSDANAVLDAYYDALPEKRARFELASYWYRRAMARNVQSHSLTLLLLAMSIESLRKNTRHGATKGFMKFLERFAPGSDLSEAERERFYDARSEIAHGRDLYTGDRYGGFPMSPYGLDDIEEVSAMYDVTREALSNWVRCTDPDLLEQ